MSSQQASYNPPKKRHGGAIVVGVVVVVIIIIGVGYYLANSGNIGNPTVKVTITGLNLQIAYNGLTGGYLGPTSQAISYSDTVNGGQQFSVTFSLTDTALLLNHQINSVTVSTNGFSVISVSPNMPYSMSPDSTVTITVNLGSPGSSFDGPLTLSLATS